MIDDMLHAFSSKTTE